MECKHKWIANSGSGGEPEFRPNRQMSPEPLMHVTCEKCNARTWMTAAQWEEAERIRRRPNPAHGAPKPAGHNPVA